jgi:hypothetical protein
MYTFSQLARLNDSLKEPVRLEILFYLYTYKSLHLRELQSVLSSTHALVSRHCIYLKNIGICDYHLGGPSKYHHCYYINKEYLPFFDLYFGLMDKADAERLRQKYEQAQQKNAAKT